MIKFGIKPLLPHILKLFNGILKVETCWGTGLIVSIFKSGDTNEPSTYRGITLSSCLSTFFNKIMNKRLTDFIDRRKMVYTEQIEFKRDSRTADHIFVLKSTIDFYKRKRQPIYGSFTDLRRVFDSVWRAGIFFKLLKSGINSKLAKIIRRLYNRTQNRVLVDGKVSAVFRS
jgi:hypothetical protein